jgi:tetratricopeptide (TPR) repeat protein
MSMTFAFFMDMYLGRQTRAASTLQEGVAADTKAKSSGRAAQKYVALAEASLGLGQAARAAAAATAAVKLSRHESILFPAARVLLHAGHDQQALQIAGDLEKLLQRQTTAYARLIAGEVAFERGRFADAIDAYRDAQKRRDSWFSRFLLGRAYVATGHFPEALAELELCVKRQGETADVFVYDMPTLRYLPPAYYWLARAQEGTGVTTQARQNYDHFLKLRSEADPADPLAADAQKRLRSLS